MWKWIVLLSLCLLAAFTPMSVTLRERDEAVAMRRHLRGYAEAESVTVLRWRPVWAPTRWTERARLPRDEPDRYPSKVVATARVDHGLVSVWLLVTAIAAGAAYVGARD
jgi:hypothetical protein